MAQVSGGITAALTPLGTVARGLLRGTDTPLARAFAWMERLKQRVGRSLHDSSDPKSSIHLADGILIALIGVSVATAVLESVEWIRAGYAPVFATLEIGLTSIFAVEYALRLWSCTVHPRYAGGWAGRLRYAVTPVALIDLLAVLPFLVANPTSACPLMLRAVRLCRLLRVLKLTRYSQSLQLVYKVVRSRREELGVILCLDGLLIMVAATLLYVVENGPQPQVFSSIPASMWWAVITLTTIGYGDAYPVTVLGKILTGLLALLAVGMIALPTGLLSSSFMEEIVRNRTHAGCCPTCGRPLEHDGDEHREGGAR